MTALWGRHGGTAARPLFARCVECAWTGPEHSEPTADAVILAVADAHDHNLAAHPEPAEVPEGALF